MKRTIKLLLALTLVSSMLMSLCPISQAITDPNLTYELDFSALDQNTVTTDAGEIATATGGRGLKSAITPTGVTINAHNINSNFPLKTTKKDGVTALDFNGKNGFYVTSTDGSAFGSKDISVEMWIYKENTTKTGGLFRLKQTVGGTNEMELYYLGGPTVANKMQFYPFEGVKKTYTFSEYHNVEKWEHIVITRTYDTDTSATTKIYSNGVRQETYQGTNLPTFVAPQAIWIGNYDGGNDIGTLLAEFKFYKKALTETEIVSNFNAQLPKYKGKVNMIGAPDYKTESITLKVTNDISQITADNIVITEKATDNEVATVNHIVDTTNKTITFDVTQMLKPGKEYTLKFIPDTEKVSIFDPDPISFTVKDYIEKSEISHTEETNNLKIITEFYEASVGKNVCVLAVIYDETGRMVKADGTIQEFEVTTENKTSTLNINSTNFKTGYKVKVYAWNMDGTVPMQTISKPYLIEITE